MKKMWMFLGLLTGLLLVAGVVHAQFAPVFSEVRVTVPFVFYAGDAPMTAGAYTIKRMNDFEPQMLALTAANGGKTVFLLVHLNDTGVMPKTSEVSFNKYGDQYFLSDIAIEGYSNHQQLNRSRTEELAAVGELHAEVILPARLN